MSQGKSLRFFYLKIDGSRYNQKFKTYESAHDFAMSVFEHMMKENEIIEKVEIFDHKNKKIKEVIFSKHSQVII